MKKPSCPNHPESPVIKYVNKGVKMRARWACLACGKQLGLAGKRDKDTIVLTHAS